MAVNKGGAAATYTAALLSAGADPREKDAAGNTALSDAKKAKNTRVLALLQDWQPPLPAAEALEALAAVREQPWYGGWRSAVFKAVDKCFDEEEEAVVELLAITSDDSHAAETAGEMALLMQDLEAAYRSGQMGGGSYRMCRPVRIGETQLVKKLSKLEDELYVVVIACAAKIKAETRAEFIDIVERTNTQH